MSDYPSNYDDAPIQPLLCPRCRKPVKFNEDDTIECKDCGELYPDRWLGIWRVRPKSAKNTTTIMQSEDCEKIRY